MRKFSIRKLLVENVIQVKSWSNQKAKNEKREIWVRASSSQRKADKESCKVRPLINTFSKRILFSELAFPSGIHKVQPLPSTTRASLSVAGRTRLGIAPRWTKSLSSKSKSYKNSLGLNLAQRVHSELTEVQMNPLFSMNFRWWTGECGNRLF